MADSTVDTSFKYIVQRCRVAIITDQFDLIWGAQEHALSLMKFYAFGLDFFFSIRSSKGKLSYEYLFM